MALRAFFCLQYLYLSFGQLEIKRPLGRLCRHGCQAATGLDTRSKRMMLLRSQRIHLASRLPEHPHQWRCADSNRSVDKP
jgi:hypothetical protein